MRWPEIPYSTALVTALVLAIIGLVLLLSVMADHIIRHAAWAVEDEEAEHAEFVAELMTAFEDRLFAEKIRALADRYDSDQGIREMTYLRREVEKHRAVGGPTLPALWLHLQADRIDPPTLYDTRDKYGNFAGLSTEPPS